MKKQSVIILSYAIDEEILQMNCRCVNSLFSSEIWSDGELVSLLNVQAIKSCYYAYVK